VCGIAGALSPLGETPPQDLVPLMMVAQLHRGPDGGALFADGPVVLGHRRLSIVDLSEAGRQPLLNEDGRVAAIVNGEIYNHEQLRADLERKGHTFRSHSDSEVVVHLYEEYGERTPEFLRGMFALAIWDSSGHRLLLARDRLGEKPLVYARVDGTFIFASEIAALLVDDRVGRQIDLAALDAYLALQYVPNPDTIFSDIKKLPPGCSLDVRPGQPPRLRRYYQLPLHADRDPNGTANPPTNAGDPAWPATDAETLHRVRTTVEEAIASRLMSDVPLGAFLSGGIDSSIVVACMARRSAQPVKTFSVGFSQAGASELPFARQIAERYRTDHHELTVEPDMVSMLPSIARHHGEPFGDTSAVPTRYLCEMTRRHVTVALSGDAGDEVFGGYRRYVWAHVADLLRRLPRFLTAAVAGTLAAIPGARARWLRRYGAALSQTDAERYLEFVAHFPGDQRQSVLSPALAERFRVDETALRFTRLLGDCPGASAVNRLSALDLQTYLPDDILAKVDVASMTHSLEARAPLVDHHVVELGLRLPGRLKLDGLEGKAVLKRAFADLIPPAILARSKRGFALPTRHWLAGSLHGFARETLLSSAARSRDLFRPEAVEGLLDRHKLGEDHGEQIWNLLVLETWFRELVDGRSRFVADIRSRLHLATSAVAVA